MLVVVAPAEAAVVVVEDDLVVVVVVDEGAALATRVVGEASPEVAATTTPAAPAAPAAPATATPVPIPVAIPDAIPVDAIVPMIPAAANPGGIAAAPTAVAPTTISGVSPAI